MESKEATRRAGLCGAIVALLVLLALAPTAWAAGVYHVNVCSDLSTGAGAPADLWTQTYVAPEGYADAGPCSVGGTMYAQFQAAVAHAYGDYEQMGFTAPSGTAISAFSLWRDSHVGPNQPYGTPQAGIFYDSTWVDQLSSGGSVVDAGSASSPTGSTVSASGLGAHTLAMRVQCGGGAGGSCAAGGTGTWIHVHGGDITLSASSPPSVSNVSGPLTSSSTLTGNQSISYNATDGGGGVYSAILSVDGNPTTSAIANANGGRCPAVRVNSDGSRVFNYAVPCPLSTSGSVSLDTSQLTDGSHALQLIVDDAAGVQTVAYNGTITTHNAPGNTTAPAVSGAAQQGQTLTSDNGAWSPAATYYTYKWQRCDAGGQGCAVIQGATNPTYTLSSADAYHTVVAQVTAHNAAGASPPASSNPVGPVADAVGGTTPPTTSSGGSGSLSGGLTGAGAPAPPPAAAPAAAPAACAPQVSTSVQQQPDGSYLLSGSVTCNGVPVSGAKLTVTDGSGLSRTLTANGDGTFSTVLKTLHDGLSVTYGAQHYDVTTHAAGGHISLKVSPARTRNHHRITFTGKVTGVAIAAAKRQVLLVEYRLGGKWHPFDQVVLRPNGTFLYTYRFKRTTRPTVYHFRVALSSLLASPARNVRVMP